MPELVQEIFPGQGALNWDDDHRFFAKGDSEYRLHMIPNEFGVEYSLSNMMGNTLYNHTFTHGTTDATYQTVGDCYDDNRDCVYFFIYSALAGDSILRFNFSDHSFDKIVWDHSGIGLDPDYPITDAFMIGNWLHFNPRTSSPRVINVQWAYYDFVTYSTLGDANRPTGTYVRFRQRVYITLESVPFDHVPQNHPDEFDFVDYCYEDVYPLDAEHHATTPATAGDYMRYRNFYNTTTPLPYTPSASVETDTNYEYNNIRGGRFQFCYRHYVPDQGYTNASSFTGIIAPPSSETNKGEVVGDIQAYNKINITFPIANEIGATEWYDYDMLFEFIEVLFREGPDDDWKVAERIAHSVVALALSGESYSIDFFNDKAYEVVDNVAIEKQYNPLPRLAKAQWSLDGERSAYGGVTEGFDVSLDLDVTLTVGEREITLDSPPAGSDDEYEWDSVTYDSDRRQWLYTSEDIQVPVAAADGDVIGVTVDGIDYYKIIVDPPDLDSDADYAALMVELLALAGITAYVDGGVNTYVNFWSTSPSGYITSIFLYGAATPITLALKYGSFKNGAWHSFCQLYYDESLRRCEPVFDNNYRAYVSTLPEAVPGESTNYQRYIGWEIAHTPPQWARYWRWGYAGNQTISKFWQYNVAEIAVDTKDTTDNWTRLDISPLQKIADDTSGYDHYFPDTAIEAYSFEPGDRVRFITTEIDSPVSHDLLQVAAENKDYEIKEFDDTNNYVYIDLLEAPLTTTTTESGSDDVTVIIEIYRPKKQAGDTVYYEFGDLYPVYLDSGVYYHGGDSQDQTSVLTATGEFTQGDVFVITRLFSLKALSVADAPVFVESYGWSDFHDTDGWGKGKAGVFLGLGEKYLNNIRHSNRYSPNTRSSGLSTFDPSDYIEMSVDHGNITAMRQAGNTLKVYFERNSAAVLVNKAQIYNADGTSQIIKSDNVLGDAVYSNYHYGTIFPESVFLKDRTVYFFDIYRDAFIRDSSNGIEPISDYKMRRCFDEKATALLASGVSNVQVWTTYDYEYDMVYIHFIDSCTPTNDEVILFHEPQNRWVTFLQVNDTILEVPTTTSTTTSTSTSSTSSTSTHDYDTGIIFGKGSMKLVSYIGDGVYIHNSNATRNNFWGTQRESIVHVTANESPNIKKTFEAMAIHSNKPWDVNYISVDLDGTYVNGMQSKLPESKFRLIEGIYCANYLRNMKTYDTSASNLDLIRGEMLRGYYADHRLVNDDTTEVTLFKVDVSGNVSRI